MLKFQIALDKLSNIFIFSSLPICFILQLADFTQNKLRQ